MNALVTGSSTGIGRAIALELAGSGYDVTVHGRTDSEELAATLRELKKIREGCASLIFDFAEQGNLSDAVEQAFDGSPQINLWVNNAGCDVLTGELLDAGFDEKLDRLIEVDVKTTLRLSRLAGQRMGELAKQSGRPSAIINIGWDQAFAGIADESGQFYSTTKGAIMAMTGSLAKALSPQVRVNCVAPGWIQTEWGKTASEKWQQRAVMECMLQRWGQPEDVARVVRFLASEDAEFINGQVINVNGGFAGTWNVSDQVQDS